MATLALSEEKKGQALRKISKEGHSQAEAQSQKKSGML
jgi:hypothetical protein